MSHPRALSRLLRWREFDESRASDALRASSVEAACAQQRRDLAEEAKDTQRASRGELLAHDRLDLAALHAAMQLEADAEARLRERDELLRMAREEEARMREAHLQARARTRVVATRHARVAAEVAGQREKAEFDRVADACQSIRRRPA